MITWEEFEAMKDEKGNIPNFFEIVKKDLGIENNPKADAMMRIAWESGHSCGYHEVYNDARDLVELIR
jgi:hypothetical protein